MTRVRWGALSTASIGRPPLRRGLDVAPPSPNRPGPQAGRRRRHRPPGGLCPRHPQRQRPEHRRLPLKQPDLTDLSASVTSRAAGRPGSAAGPGHRDPRAGRRPASSTSEAAVIRLPRLASNLQHRYDANLRLCRMIWRWPSESATNLAGDRTRESRVFLQSSDGCCCADVPAPKTSENRSRATLSSPEAYASSPTVPR